MNYASYPPPHLGINCYLYTKSCTPNHTNIENSPLKDIMVTKSCIGTTSWAFLESEDDLFPLWFGRFSVGRRFLAGWLSG